MGQRSSRKIFAGAKIRALRQTHELTQAAFADRLGVSTSYLNQIENNQRSISASVILALADAFSIDVASLATDETDRVLADLKEVFSDPLFASEKITSQEIKIAAGNTPAVTDALLTLYRAYVQTNERIANFDNVLAQHEGALDPLPYEEVRDYFHYSDNYIDALDKAGEELAAKLNGHGQQTAEALISRLSDRHGVRVVMDSTDMEPDALRLFDPRSNILSLNASSSRATQLFHLAHQIGLLEQSDLIDELLDNASFHSADAVKVCKISLANYYAGAVLLPYTRFREAAKEVRHDLEQLVHLFGASLEQVAHRLSTLQRPGNKGVPFFFVRVDQAGNITKRHSATKFQFARFSGGCPLWNVHRAFETPDRIVRQLAKTPDGVKYLCLARNLTKRSGGFRAPIRRYSIALGCEIKYADQLVYADDLDIENDQVYEQIGISCRICEREHCPQRAIPPIGRSLEIDHSCRRVVPFSVGDTKN